MTIFFLIIFLSVSFAELKPQVTSKSVEYDYKNHIVIFCGNVEGKFEDGNFYAEKAFFYENENRIKLEENIRIDIKTETDEITVLAQKLDYNVDAGKIYISTDVKTFTKEIEIRGKEAIYDEKEKVIFFNKVIEPPIFIYKNKHEFMADEIIVRINERKVFLKKNVRGKLLL